jgi:hypothetical protein
MRLFEAPECPESREGKYFGVKDVIDYPYGCSFLVYLLFIYYCKFTNI